MRRVVGGAWHVATVHSRTCVYICIATFFLGGLCGIFSAGHVDGVGAEALWFYMQSFLHVAQSGQLRSPDFAGLIWTIFRWPLFTIICSMTIAGSVLIPALLLGRGFLLFFALSSLLRIMPSGGVVVFVLLGLSALCSVPALLILSIQGLQHVGIQRVKRERFHLPPRLIVGILSGFVACLLVDYYVVPVLFSALSHGMVG